MIVRMAELEIEPDCIDAYAALLSEQIESAVRLEPGVIFLHAVSVRGSPQSVRVIEGYADQASYEAHLVAPHFLAYKARTAAMVKSLTLVETDPILLRAKPG